MKFLRKGLLLRLLALFAALLMVASACSSDDGEVAEDGNEVVVDESGDGDEDIASGEATGEDTREDVEGGPVRGGTLVYGLEADQSSPWAPFGMVVGISGSQMLGSIADPLFDVDEDGKTVPVLAAGIEPNEDATEWTLTLREGVMFTDGTPVDAEAVKYNINVCRASSRRGGDFARIVDVQAPDALTVVFTLDAEGGPWSAFPNSALDTPCGIFLMSPTWLKSLEANPLREESRRTGTDLIDQETIDTPATGDITKPVSMGAFQLVSYTPGNGNGFTAERNPTYWRGDEGAEGSVTGEGLPYLDAIEFVIVEDFTARSAGLQSGQFDIIHTDNADEIVAFRGEDGFVQLEANAYGETSYYLINLAVGELDPDGLNADNPLIDLRVRKALAHAMDRQRVADERGAGIVQAANGPFSPGQTGYLEDNGYPEYDAAAAVALLDEYIADPERSDGKAVGDPISFELITRTDPSSTLGVEHSQLVTSMWQDAFGDKIEITVERSERGPAIDNAVAGTFDMQAWRQHGGSDHDRQLRFWMSATGAPVGSSTFNFQRLAVPELDELADFTRQSTDQAARIEKFEEMNRLFGENVYQLPTIHTLWGIVASDFVQDIAGLPLPGGGTSFPVISGEHHVTQIWCTDGTCD